MPSVDVAALEAEFESSNSAPSERCPTCRHPAREVIDRLLRKGYGAERIALFLRERGFPTGDAGIGHHKRHGHHTQADGQP